MTNNRYYNTTRKIVTDRFCANCPLKLYAKEDDKVILGIGNICGDILFILPSYDISTRVNYDNMFDITNQAYCNVTGRDIIEDYYVTRYVKCHNKTSFKLDDICVNHCFHNLLYEINRIKPKKIASFDRNLSNVLNGISANIRIYNITSPGVMYYSNQYLKDKFMNELMQLLE